MSRVRRVQLSLRVDARTLQVIEKVAIHEDKPVAVAARQVLEIGAAAVLDDHPTNSELAALIDARFDDLERRLRALVSVVAKK